MYELKIESLVGAKYQYVKKNFQDRDLRWKLMPSVRNKNTDHYNYGGKGV